jgi:hypothetical protein
VRAADGTRRVAFLVAAAVVVLAVAPAPAARADDEPAAEQVVGASYSRIWGMTLTFPGDPWTFTYDAWKEFPGDLGSSRLRTTDGNEILVPNYVLSIRNTLNAARAWFAKNGLAIQRLDPDVYVEPSETFAGAYKPGTGNLLFADGLSVAGLLTTPIHELWHVVEHDQRWISFNPARTATLKTAVEGTAEWATDLPIEIPLAGVTWEMLKDRLRNEAVTETGPAKTVWANLLNQYCDEHASAVLDAETHGRGLLAGKNFEYRSVFLWKSLAQSGGSWHTDVRPIVDFWKRIGAHALPGEAEWMDALGATARHGRTEANARLAFRRFFEDHVANCVAVCQVRSGGPGFQEEAFNKGAHQVLNPHVEAKGYGARPTAIAERPAADDAERQRRLLSVAVRLGDVGRFGHKTLVVEPGSRVEDDDVATSVFLVARGDVVRDDAWGAVALLHDGEKAFQRGQVKGKGGAFVLMDRLPFSLQERPGRLDGRPIAYHHMREFGKAGAAERIWVAVANIDPQGEAASAEVGFAVVPRFAPLSAKGKTPEGLAVRSGSRVGFVRSEPARRWPDDSFRAGDRVTLRVNVTDAVHLGRDGEVPADRRTLIGRLVGADGKDLALEGASVRAVAAEDTDTWSLTRGLQRYEWTFRLPESAPPGRYRAHLEVSSLLRLGAEDRDEETSFDLLVEKERPHVTEARLSSGKPGIAHPFVDDLGRAMRPVEPGPVAFEIRFSLEMDTKKPAEVRLGTRALAGKWKDGRTYSGTFDVPGGAAYAEWKGVHALSIQASSAEGVAIDEDPSAPGDQPDASRRVVVDGVPPRVSSVKVIAGGKTVYDAQWKGGPEYDVDVRSWREEDVREATRTLDPDADLLPADGHVAEMYLSTTQDLAEAPLVKVGGEAVPVKQSGHPRAWMASIELARLRESIAGYRPIPVEIAAVDVHGNALDAHPRTVPRLRLPEPGGSPWWTGYESLFAGPDDGRGGPDENHRLNAYEPHEEWIDKNEKLGTETWFRLVVRGGGVQARFGTGVYEGRLDGGLLRASQRVQSLEDLYDDSWYRDYQRVSSPPRSVLQQLWAKHGRELTRRYEMRPDGPDRYVGPNSTFTIEHEDGNLESVDLRGVPWPHVWTRQMPSAPVATPDAPAKPPEKPKRWPQRTEAWTRYLVKAKVVGGVKVVDVHEVELQRFDDGTAQLTIRRFPVAHMQLDGAPARFRVNWRHGRRLEASKAAAGPESERLAARAEVLKKEGFERPEVNDRVAAALGPGSTPLR